jgi:hypothetical protein
MYDERWKRSTRVVSQLMWKIALVPLISLTSTNPLGFLKPTTMELKPRRTLLRISQQRAKAWGVSTTITAQATSLDIDAAYALEHLVQA